MEEEWGEDGEEASQVQVKNHSERRKSTYNGNLRMAGKACEKNYSLKGM